MSTPLETYPGRNPPHEEVERLGQPVLVAVDEQAFDEVEGLLVQYDRTTLRLYGDVSSATNPELESLIDSLLALQPKSLIIDLSGASFVSEEVLDRLQSWVTTARVPITVGAEVP
jgi:hypothetical protein